MSKRQRESDERSCKRCSKDLYYLDSKLCLECEDEEREAAYQRRVATWQRDGGCEPDCYG
jgi:ribosomal protein L37E